MRLDQTFSNLEYSFKTLENRLRELAFLNSGVRIMLTDERARRETRPDLRGRRARVRPLSRPLQNRADGRTRSSSTGEKDGIGVEVAMWWNDSYHENVLPLHQQHPAARRRHPSGGLSGGADADDEPLCRVVRASPRRKR